MALSRRKMFGAAAGAAVAGPSAVRAAVESVGQAQATAVESVGRIGDTLGAKTADPRYEAEKLAKLRRIASGDIRPEDIADQPHPGMPRETFGALRSVSSEARHFITQRYWERRNRERMVERALETLREYDKTGFLRYINIY